jgi:hypothetical protein
LSISLQQTMIVYSLNSLPWLKSLIRKGSRVRVPVQKIEVLLRMHGRLHPGQAAGASGGRREVQVTQLTVSFLDIGQRQLITAPAHSIPVYAKG